MRLAIGCFLALCLVAACSSRGAQSPGRSESTLVGRWTANVPGAPCAFDLELMDDGTAWSNFLNDDTPGELCRSRSVTFAAGHIAADALTFSVGDQVVRYCWYSFSGPYLDLVCDEHRPPTRGATPLRFARPETAESSAEAPSLLGDWQDGPILFTFLPGGVGVIRNQQIGYRILNAREIELQWPGPERCTYEFRGKDELLLGCPSMSMDLRRSRR